MQKYLRLILTVSTCFVVGYVCFEISKSETADWFFELKLPVFCLPFYVFKTVFLLFLALLGLAAGMVWNKLETEEILVKKGFSFFVIVLFLSVLWFYLFYSLHNIFLALIEAVLLLLMVFETYSQFKKIDALAGKLALPYLICILYVVLLNGSFWVLNQ